MFTATGKYRSSISPGWNVMGMAGAQQPSGTLRLCKCHNPEEADCELEGCWFLTILGGHHVSIGLPTLQICFI